MPEIYAQYKCTLQRKARALGGSRTIFSCTSLLAMSVPRMYHSTSMSAYASILDIFNTDDVLLAPS